MEQRPLDITLISAKGLKDVGAFSKMDVYVTACITTNPPGSEQKTPVDEDGGSSPKWNHLMRFVVDEPSVQMNRAVVVFRLKHERKMLGDKDVGEVHVAVKELLDKAGAEKGDVAVEYSVKTPSGKEKGSLKFSFKFGEVYKVEHAAYAPPPPAAYAPQHDGQKMVEPYPQQAPGYYPPPVGYPMQGPSGSHGPPQPAYAAPYAAPPGGYPQGPPPQYGYGGGYQQPPPGGYAPMGYQGGYQQPGYKPQKPKKSGGMGAGAGLGLGLAGGLIGGMIVGEMVDDAFDDCGDF